MDFVQILDWFVSFVPFEHIEEARLKQSEHAKRTAQKEKNWLLSQQHFAANDLQHQQLTSQEGRSSAATTERKLDME